MVKDVKPYEFMKLRLLNGGHSCLSYISVLCGYNYVDDAMADPLISGVPGNPVLCPCGSCVSFMLPSCCNRRAPLYRPFVFITLEGGICPPITSSFGVVSVVWWATTSGTFLCVGRPSLFCLFSFCKHDQVPGFCDNGVMHI